MNQYRARKAVDPHVLLAEVVTTKQVSPNIVRVTLGGLDQFTAAGYDQWFRLFMQRPGQDAMRLPTRTSSLGWYAQYLVTSRTHRPLVRNYTVRAARPDLHEVDVDFVAHVDADGRSGPAVSFATTAKAGDEVGFLDQGVSFNPRHEHDWTLLVADETGLPAVAGICESLPDDARGVALVEIPVHDDAQDFRVPDGVDVRWVVRDDPRDVPGRAALTALREAALPDGVGYAFAVGESALATGARRHLVGERGMPKAHVDFMGYWKHGVAAPS